MEEFQDDRVNSSKEFCTTAQTHSETSQGVVAVLEELLIKYGHKRKYDWLYTLLEHARQASEFEQNVSAKLNPLADCLNAHTSSSEAHPWEEVYIVAQAIFGGDRYANYVAEHVTSILSYHDKLDKLTKQLEAEEWQQIVTNSIKKYNLPDRLIPIIKGAPNLNSFYLQRITKLPLLLNALATSASNGFQRKLSSLAELLITLNTIATSNLKAK